MLEEVNGVQEVLGRSYGLPEDVDEDDLEAGKRSRVDMVKILLYKKDRR